MRFAAVPAVLIGFAAAPAAGPAAAQTPAAPAETRAPARAENPNVAMAFQLFAPTSEARRAAIRHFTDRADADAIPALIQALRFVRSAADAQSLIDALTELAGENPSEAEGGGWAGWQRWLEAHPEIRPFEGFATFKSGLYAQIDPDFLLFLREGVAHEIRLEEIVWGGVVKDGIPALTNPKRIAAAEADYLTEEELVFGVEIDGDARAYPLRILDWHEMLNDVVGGVPVSLAYCTLCGSGVLFETRLPGRDAHFVFGSSGFLYRSNKLMYDTETNSLWNQFTGRPVVGPLTGSGIELSTRPVVIASWADWRARHPDTTVLSLDTGHVRDYTPGRPYGGYFASPDLMFPARVEDDALAPKEYVFALRSSGTEKAWPLALFERSPVINDVAGAVPLTLLGAPETRTVRAYRTRGEAFEPGDRPDLLRLGDAQWRVEEAALIGPTGERYARLPGHIAYWFAWSGYFGDVGERAAAP
ncbi:MAG: DUF3179 domain-containing protein [Pseudomonadota bacterium]